jgi:hypothetical protein
VGRSAIFCAALTAIEQCKTEVAIDVFHAVKGIRIQKPGAVVSVVRLELKLPIILFILCVDHYDSRFKGCYNNSSILPIGTILHDI